MIRVAVLGASGRMGRLVLREVLGATDLQLVGAHTHEHSKHLGVDAGVHSGGVPCGLSISPLISPTEADVVIDFALPEGTVAALPFLGNAALVSGTTGLSDVQLRSVKAHRGPLLLASNFSTGVNVLLALVSKAAAALPDFDIEIIEAHHHHKVDAPSGTALALAHSAATARGVDLQKVRKDGRSGLTGPRESGTIGIHALRAGSITGHHSVWIAGMGERIQLTHEASSREIFARGALRAARWIAGKPTGSYTMHNVLGL